MENEKLQAMSVDDRLRAVSLSRCIHCGHVDDADEMNICGVCGTGYCDACARHDRSSTCQCSIDKAVEAIAGL